MDALGEVKSPTIIIRIRSPVSVDAMLLGETTYVLCVLGEGVSVNSLPFSTLRLCMSLDGKKKGSELF